MKLNTGNPATFGFKMPESIKTEIIKNADKATGYCDIRGMLFAREAICNYHMGMGIKGICPDDVFITNGVSEASYLIVSAICSRGDEFLVPAPCYSLWVNMIRLSGGVPVFYDCNEDNGWMPDANDIKSKITEKTKAILIINPNNPTGALYSKKVLQEIYDVAKEKNLIILSDEIYDRLVYDDEEFVSTGSLGEDVTLITFNGLSKSHCICGLRCGWLVVSGPQESKGKLNEALVTLASVRLCSNAMMQLVIPCALNDREYTKNMIEKGGRLYESQKEIERTLSKVDGISFVPNKAAFYVFPKIDLTKFDFESDKDFAAKLLDDKKILVVPGSGFYAKDNAHFRIVALPDKSSLKTAIEQIGEFVEKYRK